MCGTYMPLILSGQVADFGMTRQLSVGTDQSARHSVNLMAEMPGPTTTLTSMFGTGAACTFSGLH